MKVCANNRQLSLGVFTRLLPFFSFLHILYSDWTVVRQGGISKWKLDIYKTLFFTFCRMYLILFQIGYFMFNSLYVYKQTHSLRWDIWYILAVTIRYMYVYKMQSININYCAGKSINKTLQYTLALINKLQALW